MNDDNWLDVCESSISRKEDRFASCEKEILEKETVIVNKRNQRRIYHEEEI